MKKVFIAYSGGLDSHVLLHLLTQIRKIQPKLQLTAIYINHNLNPKAKIWAKHCKKTCRALRVNCLIKNTNAKIKLKNQSPEEIARNLRYEILAKILLKNSILMTAHHANDQAETLLLQLFRGAGPKGLAAMPAKTKFAAGYLVRPLLSFSREELLQYAKAYKLNWIEDESNADTKFDRNLIRHKLMPIIKKTWPGIITTLNRVANHCGAANEVIENLAAEDLSAAIIAERINIESLKKLSLIRQYNALRFWLHTLHLPTPSEAKLHEVVRTAINSRSDKNPVIKWQGAEIRRFENYLYAMSPLLSHDNKIILRFYLSRPLKLPGNLGILSAKINSKFKERIKNKILTVRFRQGGEKIKLSNRKNTHQLKKLMQEWRIPPWLRDRIPLVYCDEKIIAAVGYYSINKAKFFIN